MAPFFRHIGKSTPREDALEIVTGEATFIDDLRLPGLLHGKVLRSSHAHAVLQGVDIQRAQALEGVHAVLTHRDVPAWKAGTPPHARVLDSKVRFVGDAVALVAAETEEIAEEALDLIHVEYEPLEAVLDVEDALKPDAPQLYDAFPGNEIPPGFPAYGPDCLSHLRMGDTARGFSDADVVCEGTYGYDGPFNPLPIEPPGVIAHWETPGRLVVWSATQSASWHRFVLLPAMGFPDIRSIATHCGGSFGSKNYAPLPCFYAAALARVTKRPVRVSYSKAEQLGAFVMRPGSRLQGKIGLKKDGTVTAFSGEWLVDTGAFSDMAQAQIGVGLGEAQLLLRCENWDLRSRLVCTNHTAAGVVRGFGGQELESALMPLIMDALIQADLNPVSFFKKNFVKPGQGYFWREGKWWVSRGADFTPVLDRGAEAFGWAQKWKGWLTPTEVRGTRRRGVGVMVHGNADVGEDVSEAYVRLNPDGTAVVHVCVSESGMGQRSSLSKMAAEVLQLPLDRVRMAPPDTLVNPFEFGLVGSRGTYTVGSAVIRAAEDAREKLLQAAATRLDAEPDTLTTEDGKVFPKNRTEKKLSWSRILGITGTVTGMGRFEHDFTLANFLALFVEVEVDTETGKVDVARVLAATDVGQIIDPARLHGQLYGCFGSAGLDTALFEESILDREKGYMLNPNMVDYKWRTFPEMPPMENLILETPMASHRFKAVGVGEISTSPGPGAVLMAVSNALGTRMQAYPITPDRVLRAAQKSRKSR
jgi:CO/xanthine dehydrogenase Mo-binding subunit